MFQSWQTWSPYITTTICSTCMAAGLGNLYRLPQTTLLRGGLPFIVVYLALTICLGLPLLFLELGIGQLAQEGVIKSWRAVPFFKGRSYLCLFYKSYPLMHDFNWLVRRLVLSTNAFSESIWWHVSCWCSAMADFRRTSVLRFIWCLYRRVLIEYPFSLMYVYKTSSKNYHNCFTNSLMLMNHHKYLITSKNL